MEPFEIFLFSLWIILESTAVVISVFGNSIVIFVMSEERKLRKKSTIYNISIAVADLLSSIFIIVLTIIRSFSLWGASLKLQPGTCLWMTSVLYVLRTVSILQLVFVSIDRYCAVCHAISYHKSNDKYTKSAVALCWIAGTLLGIIALIVSPRNNNKCSLHKVFSYLHSSIGFCSVVVITVMYSLIYKAFHKQV